MKQSFGNRATDAKDQKWRFKEANRNGNLVKGQKQGFMGGAKETKAKALSPHEAKSMQKAAFEKAKHVKWSMQHASRNDASAKEQKQNNMEEKRTSSLEKHKSASAMKNAMKNSFQNRGVDAKDQKWRMKDANRNGQLVKGQKHGFDRQKQAKVAPAKAAKNGIDMEMIDDMKS